MAHNKSLLVTALVLTTLLMACDNPLDSVQESTTFHVHFTSPMDVAGNIPSDPTSYEEGDTVTVPGPGTMAVRGHRFVDWTGVVQTTAQTTFAPGSTFVMGSEDVGLSARWEEIETYSISYFGNGSTNGTAPEDPSEYQEGATASILGPGSLSRDDHSFAGWNTCALGNGDRYVAGSSLTMRAIDVSLFAEWTPAANYTITYHGNENTGGAVPVDRNRYYAGDIAEIAGPGSLVRDGYQFAYWNTQPDESGDYYVAGPESIMPTHHLDLYAVWHPVPKHSVMYEGNGHTAGMPPADSATYVEGDSVTVLGQGSLEREGYEFVGWSPVSNYTGPTFAPGSGFNMENDSVTLHAIWDSTFPDPEPYNRVWNGDFSLNDPISSWWNEITATVEYDTEMHTSEAQSLRIEANGNYNSNDPIRIERNANLELLNLVPGKSYVFSANLRVSGEQVTTPTAAWSDWNKFAMLLIVLDDWTVMAENGIEQTDTWVSVDLEFVAPDPISGFISIGSVYETMWIDDVILIEAE